VTIDTAAVHDQVAARLQLADQWYTSGRRQLVELLLELGRPASVPDLVETGPKLTQSSMYRNMTTLESAGVVQKVIGSDDRIRFELAEDLIGHHHHMVCSVCGTVEDFVIPARSERALEATIKRAIAGTGFRSHGHRLDVLGVCAGCS
jgi:Fur family transcriptional regulator, ferric uptake regulator